MDDASRKKVRAVATIAALALLPLIPYAIWGYAGQDFEYHVTSWRALREAWLAGRLMPTWDAHANFGLGDPHLGLYPPVSMVAGGILALLLPLRLAPGVFVWAALVLSGVAMYWASRSFISQPARLPAAVLYMLSPYLVTTALVRFAAGELLVQAWLPLILLYFFRVVWQKETQANLLLSFQPDLLLALLLGLSWLTNIPESIVLLYCLGIVAVLFAWMQRSIVPVLRVGIAEAIALGLAGFYLAPLWQERVWINQTGLIRVDPGRLLLFMPHHGVETLKVFKYSCWLFACAGMLILLACLWKRTRPLREDAPAETWSALMGVAFFFQLPIALLLWRHLPQLILVEFAFRFLPVMGAALPLVLLAPGTRRVWRKPACALIGFLTLLPLLEYGRAQSDASTRVPPFAELWRRWNAVGYQGVPEFAPAGHTSPSEPLHLPPATVLDAPGGKICAVLLGGPKPGEIDLTASSEVPCTLRLGVFFYPYWRATDEQGTVLPTDADADGLLSLSVPEGMHRVRIVFAPHSRVRSVSLAFSLSVLLLTLLALLALARRFRGWSPQSSTNPA